MKNTVKDIFAKLAPWGTNSTVESGKNESNKDVSFWFKYKQRNIGMLEYKRGKWIFNYSNEYLNDRFVAPIMDFPIVGKTYEFDTLPPIFAARIPTLNQPYLIEKLTKYNGDKNNKASLLAIFGRKSINNPFELVVI